MCLQNRKVQVKQAHYERTNSLPALLWSVQWYQDIAMISRLYYQIFSCVPRRQRRMKSAASIQKCCGLAVFIGVTNWWLDEWITIKIIHSMAPSQEQSRCSHAEVAGVKGHFGTCAATSENCQTIEDHWANNDGSHMKAHRSLFCSFTLLRPAEANRRTPKSRFPHDQP